MQAPGWLPYRLRSRWDNLRIRYALRRLDTTPPTPVSPPAAAACEVHMLLCRRDVHLGVLALKSLLRFCETAPAVTLTDDGSLTPAQRGWIDRHVPGCRWLPRRSEDPRLQRALAGRPHLAALYQSSYHPACKLLHPCVLADQDRVVVLDADTACWSRPETLLAWLAGRGDHAWYLHDVRHDEAWSVPAPVRSAFADLVAGIRADGAAWSAPPYFFNSGLLAYERAHCRLDLAEQYLEWWAATPASLRTGQEAIWFGAWTREQTCYLVAFGFMNPPARPLGDAYRIGPDPGFAFNHFLRAGLVSAASLRRLSGLVEELHTPPFRPAAALPPHAHAAAETR